MSFSEKKPLNLIPILDKELDEMQSFANKIKDLLKDLNEGYVEDQKKKNAQNPEEDMTESSKTLTYSDFVKIESNRLVSENEKPEKVSHAGTDVHSSEPDSAIGFRDAMEPKRVDVIQDIDMREGKKQTSYRLFFQFPNGSVAFYPEPHLPGAIRLEDLAVEELPGAVEAVNVALDLPHNRAEHKGNV